MYTENGLIVGLDTVRTVIAEADVFGVGFRAFPRRLFVDTRDNAGDGPFIGVVEPLASVQERMFWLGQQRPRFGMPERFAFFFWPNSVRFLEESGLWDAIRARIAGSDGAAPLADADRALAQLRRDEYEAVRAAVRGDGYKSIWQRQPSQPNR